MTYSQQISVTGASGSITLSVTDAAPGDGVVLNGVWYEVLTTAGAACTVRPNLPAAINNAAALLLRFTSGLVTPSLAQSLDYQLDKLRQKTTELVEFLTTTSTTVAVKAYTQAEPVLVQPATRTALAAVLPSCAEVSAPSTVPLSLKDGRIDTSWWSDDIARGLVGKPSYGSYQVIDQDPSGPQAVSLSAGARNYWLLLRNANPVINIPAPLRGYSASLLLVLGVPVTSLAFSANVKLSPSAAAILADGSATLAVDGTILICSLRYHADTAGLVPARWLLDVDESIAIAGLVGTSTAVDYLPSDYFSSWSW